MMMLECLSRVIKGRKQNVFEKWMIFCSTYHFSLSILLDDALNFPQYVHSIHDGRPDEVASEITNGGGDIEADIEKELESMKSLSSTQRKLHTFVRLEIPCGMDWIPLPV